VSVRILTDSSDIRSNSVLERVTNALVARSRIREGGEFQLAPDDARAFLDEALLRHNDSYTWDSLPPAERSAVMLLAWKTVLMVQATEVASYQFPVSDQQGSADPSSRFEKLMQMIAYLDQDYQTMCQDLDIGVKNSISMGRLIRPSRRTDTYVPWSWVEDPVPSTLTLLATGDGSIDLHWTEEEVCDFLEYRLYQSAEAGIIDRTTFNRTTASQTDPGVKAGISRIKTLSTKAYTSVRVEDLSHGVFYFVVATVSLNNRSGFSNELRVSL